MLLAVIATITAAVSVVVDVVAAFRDSHTRRSMSLHYVHRVSMITINFFADVFLATVVSCTSPSYCSWLANILSARTMDATPADFSTNMALETGSDSRIGNPTNHQRWSRTSIG